MTQLYRVSQKKKFDVTWVSCLFTKLYVQLPELGKKIRKGQN